ncbi:MAG: hypothetical protein N4A46_15690 [Schleiferiaceae bacterium]|jgi:hypothetical protein|nr:hypothetical protein [Schleiferiaceae bacterium]
MERAYYVYWSLDDAAGNTFSLTEVTGFLTLFLASLFLFLYIKRNKITYDRKKELMVLTLGGALVSGLLFGFSLGDVTEEKDRYAFMKEHDLLDSVEGVITNFKIKCRETRGGKRCTESFDVGDTHFYYSDYPIVGVYGFDRTHQNGGILTNGMYTRILFIKENNRMVKIELEK